MKTSRHTLALNVLLVALATPLVAQTTEPPPAVPALESTVNLQIVLTTTGEEKVTGPETARVYSAGYDVSRLNTKAFIELLDEKYDLVTQPKDYSLVAVAVDTDTETGYRFYLKNRKPNGDPAYVYLSPEVIGLTIDASASKYREVQNGDVLVSGAGGHKHAVTLDSAGFTTQGVARGAYKIRAVTVDGVTARLSVPAAMTVSTTGYYVENAETPEAQTYIAETRWVFTAGKPVDLNDYPLPPAPEPEV